MNLKQFKLFKAGIIIVLLSIITANINFETQTIESESKSDKNVNTVQQIKSASYWTDFTFIHINGNWSNAVGWGWCTGDGSSSNPYTLENISIDASSSSTGSGIWIEGGSSY